MSASDSYAILYVDDEEKALKYFEKAYKSLCPIYTATSVKEGKAVLAEHADHIAVVISDQRMAEEQGVDLLKFVREEYPNIIRLLTTAYSDIDDAIEAVNAGEIMRYIPKPWDLKYLKLELQHALDYFFLQREKAMLIEEKLNVVQRQSGVGRVRDLLMMAASLKQYNNAVQAIRDLLLQFALPKNAIGESGLDMWASVGAEIDQSFGFINQVMQSENVATVDQLNSASFWEQHLGNGHPLKASMAGAVVELILDEAVGFEGLTSEQMALLAGAYLMVYHHGGQIVLTESGQGVKVIFPTADQSVNYSELDDYWIDEILARYEMTMD